MPNPDLLFLVFWDQDKENHRKKKDLFVLAEPLKSSGKKGKMLETSRNSLKSKKNREKKEEKIIEMPVKIFSPSLRLRLNSCWSFSGAKEKHAKKFSIKNFGAPKTTPPRNPLCRPFSCMLKGKEAPNTKNLRGQMSFWGGGSGRGGFLPKFYLFMPLLVPEDSLMKVLRHDDGAMDVLEPRSAAPVS